MILKHWPTVFRQQSDQTVRLFTGVCYWGKKSAAFVWLLMMLPHQQCHKSCCIQSADTETGKPQQATDSCPIDFYFP